MLCRIFLSGLTQKLAKSLIYRTAKMLRTPRIRGVCVSFIYIINVDSRVLYRIFPYKYLIWRSYTQFLHLIPYCGGSPTYISFSFEL